MRAALSEPSSDWRRPSRGQRAKAIALTLCAELIFVILFLGLAPKLIEQDDAPGELVTFDLAAPAPEAKKTPQKAKAEVKASKAAPAKRPPMPLPVPQVSLSKAPLVELSKEELAAADISRFGNKGDSGTKSAAVIGPGEGPGGARLHNAEWVVEPTDAELAAYMPNGARAGSSAEIACKTIDNYRVENCRLLSESPMGSGLARAMRLAAWQFKVRPPRIDGKPLIGAWVRIHFDFGKNRS